MHVLGIIQIITVPIWPRVFTQAIPFFPLTLSQARTLETPCSTLAADTNTKTLSMRTSWRITWSQVRCPRCTLRSPATRNTRSTSSICWPSIKRRRGKCWRQAVTSTFVGKLGAYLYLWVRWGHYLYFVGKLGAYLYLWVRWGHYLYL